MPIKDDTTLFLENPKSKQTKRVKAKDVLWYAPMSRALRPIRCVDTKTGKIEYAETNGAKKVSGIRLLKLETECGYILECTPDTMIYTMEDYVRADELQVGTRIKVNGQPSEAYQDKEWLEEWYVKRHKTQKEIAEMCSTEEHPISERTIRAWVKKFGLGRGDAGQTFGTDNPRYKGDDVTKKGLYERARFAMEKPNKCEMCGYVGPNIDYHHIDRNLLDYDEDNLVALCEKCHQAEHHGAIIKHVRYTTISKKESAGVDPAVDIGIAADNYVAAGFIIKGMEE